MLKTLSRIFNRFLEIPRSMIEMHRIAKKWRLQNQHNYTGVANSRQERKFPISHVTVGNHTYGPLRVIAYEHNDANLRIGSCCSIAENVIFMLGGEHDYKCISTFPFKSYFGGGSDTRSKGDIIVEDDCWFGHGTLVLSGVTLGRGTVVAAGSVITKSTEPYSIVGGNPARLIRKRFSDRVINALMKIDYAALTTDDIRSKMDILYQKDLESLSDDELSQLVYTLNHH